ncbi:MAG: hypothetical protein R3D27_01340 [Hyphomicrobiaceae bacterium]
MSLDRRSMLKLVLGVTAVAATGVTLSSGTVEAAPLPGAPAGSAVLPETPVEQAQYRRRRRRIWRRRRRVCVRRRRRIVCFWR